MQLLTTIQDTKNYLISKRKKGETIGFVPTMGALHSGHISLLERAKRENGISVSSIFVNPLQFNDKKDLEKYPRTLEQDIEKLKSAQCDILFAPTVKEMYPKSTVPLHPSEGENREEAFSFFPPLGDREDFLFTGMEGAYRPKHFQGVCVVVKKLFDIVEPTKAYFGEKDFQQLAIIKHIVKWLNLKVEIIPCPIVREADGLAMSSRNVFLTADERKNAAHIYMTLQGIRDKVVQSLLRRENLQSPFLNLKQIKKWVATKINSNPFMQLEYFEIVNAETFQPIANYRLPITNLRACIAVKVGAVRLIDNISF
ncbi:MAG: pantoate--beta-alanine ligase [Bacteroidota bacterium]